MSATCDCLTLLRANQADSSICPSGLKPLTSAKYFPISAVLSIRNGVSLLTMPISTLLSLTSYSSEADFFKAAKACRIRLSREHSGNLLRWFSK